MSADAGADGRDMLALQATVKDLLARLAMAESRLDALETSGLPSGRNRASRGLAQMADRIDAATPGKVPAYESDKLKARDGFDVK